MTLYAIYCTDEHKSKNRPVAAVCTTQESAADVLESFILEGSMDYMPNSERDHEAQNDRFREDIDTSGFEEAICHLEYGYVDIIESDEIL